MGTISGAGPIDGGRLVVHRCERCEEPAAFAFPDGVFRCAAYTEELTVDGRVLVAVWFASSEDGERGWAPIRYPRDRRRTRTSCVEHAWERQDFVAHVIPDGSSDSCSPLRGLVLPGSDDTVIELACDVRRFAR